MFFNIEFDSTLKPAIIGTWEEKRSLKNTIFFEFSESRYNIAIV